ncbi:MAG: hypothetical protein U9Q90_10745 [Campylobacterota bacterium]|nr:hypothetical protein [Campylobacterota bacterium]
MKYIRGLIVVALVSGVYASENPFAIEKNVQKIEHEENELLLGLAKEKDAFAEDDDEFEVDSKLPAEGTKVKVQESVKMGMAEEANQTSAVDTEIVLEKTEVIDEKVEPEKENEVNVLVHTVKKENDIKSQEAVEKEIEKVDAKIEEAEAKIEEAEEKIEEAEEQKAEEKEVKIEEAEEKEEKIEEAEEKEADASESESIQAEENLSVKAPKISEEDSEAVPSAKKTQAVSDEEQVKAQAEKTDPGSEVKRYEDNRTVSQIELDEAIKSVSDEKEESAAEKTLAEEKEEQQENDDSVQEEEAQKDISETFLREMKEAIESVQ